MISNEPNTANRALIRRILPYQKIPILVYHKITIIPKLQDTFRLSVPPNSFQKQMEYIAKKKRCLRLHDYVARLRKGRKIFGNSVIITFDDGYLDNYFNAFPVLKNYNLTATFFVPTRLVGLTNRWDEKRGETQARLLSWDEIVEMSTSGMSFGSHGCTHTRLTTCTDDMLAEEFRESKSTLESKLHRPIDLFSYPYGAVDSRTSNFAKSFGYSAACSDRENPNEEVDIYNLNRIPIYSSDSLSLFKLKVSGWYAWLERMLTNLRILGLMRVIRSSYANAPMD